MDNITNTINIIKNYYFKKIYNQPTNIIQTFSYNDVNNIHIWTMLCKSISYDFYENKIVELNYHIFNDITEWNDFAINSDKTKYSLKYDDDNIQKKYLLDEFKKRLYTIDYNLPLYY